jgi:hypothetical protein
VAPVSFDRWHIPFGLTTLAEVCALTGAFTVYFCFLKNPNATWQVST